MIKNIEYKEENGSIEIDNSELLSERADVSREVRMTFDAFKGYRGGLGGLQGEEENKLKTDKRGLWNEPGNSMEVMHICPICNTKFKGRTNRVYCTTKCKELGKKRRQRKRAKDFKNFKPYHGKTGEVYFMVETGKWGKEINFIPAINAESRDKARQYIADTYPAGAILANYVAQVNTVIKK